MREDYAGKRVLIKEEAGCNMNGQPLGLQIMTVEGYWDDIAGMSWQDGNGNPACILYALRVGMQRLPVDNDVLYGKIGPFGHLIHVSEIDKVVE